MQKTKSPNLPYIRKVRASNLKQTSVVAADRTLHPNEANTHHQGDDGYCGDTRHIHAGGGKIILTSGRGGLVVGVHLICGGLVVLLVSGVHALVDGRGIAVVAVGGTVGTIGTDGIATVAGIAGVFLVGRNRVTGVDVVLLARLGGDAVKSVLRVRQSGLGLLLVGLGLVQLRVRVGQRLVGVGLADLALSKLAWAVFCSSCALDNVFSASASFFRASASFAFASV